ncbi:hypothetical protein HanRHA438_Chr16g0768211 [Helianthus annuus]|nr:hypothetical protein HanRHA438_Chr16g0768211 [Helianthus annuus]
MMTIVFILLVTDKETCVPEINHEFSGHFYLFCLLMSTKRWITRISFHFLSKIVDQ